MSKQSANIPYLVMQLGPQHKQAFPLRKQLLTIGREIDNDIVVNDVGISRHHARLTWQGDKWVIEDLGSSNGTFVNGQRITAPTVIGPGSQVGLGPNVIFGMQVGAPRVARKPRKRKLPISLGLAGAAALAVLLLGVLAVLGYSYFFGGWPFGLSQGALPSGPVVFIQEPVPGAQVVEGDSFPVFVTANDEDGIVRIDLWVDDQLVISQSSSDESGISPLSLMHPMLAVKTGTYTLIARAYDSQGEVGESLVHHVTVYEMAASTQEYAQYTVQDGETLEDLAEIADTTGDEIQNANPAIPPNGQVKAGQTVQLPVKRASSQSKAAVPPSPPQNPPPNPPPAKNQPAIKSIRVSASPNLVYYGQACTNEPTTSSVIVQIDPANAAKSATLKYIYFGKAGTSGELSVPMTLTNNQFKADVDAGGQAKKHLAQDGGWATMWVEVLDTSGKTSRSKPLQLTVINCSKIIGPGAPGVQPPANVPANPPPAKQPAIKSIQINDSPDPVYYGQACTNEPTVSNVVVTVDPVTAVKSVTLKYFFSGNAGKSGDLQVPMTLSAGQFKADIDVGGQAEKYLFQDGGAMVLWAEVIDTSGKTSTSQSVPAGVIFCGSGGQAGKLPPNMPGILPGLLPGVAGQAGQMGVFQPGQGPLPGIVANIHPHWNPVGNAQPNTKLVAPDPFTATEVDECAVSLSWTDNATNESGYYVYRYDPGDPNGIIVAKLPPDSESYKDTVPQPGKYRYAVAAVLTWGGQFKQAVSKLAQIEVAETPSCQPLPTFKQIVFQALNFSPNDANLTSGFLEITVRGLPTIRVPRHANYRTGDWRGMYETRIPAPEAVYTNPGDALDFEAQGNATTDPLNDPPTALGQFSHSHNWDELTDPNLQKDMWTGSGKENGGFDLTYKLWLEDWLWTGKGTNPKMPAPYNLTLKSYSAEHALDWDYDKYYQEKRINGFIVYRRYTCAGGDVTIGYPLVVDRKDTQTRLDLSTAPVGCSCSYQVSAFGPEGESALSDPQKEDCLTHTPSDSLIVTFETLIIDKQALTKPTPTQIFLFANGYYRKSDSRYLGALTYLLKSIPLDGQVGNHSVIVGMQKNQSLQLNFYISNICRGMESIQKPGRSWEKFEGSYTISSQNGDCQVNVTVKDRAGGPAQGAGVASAKNKKNGEACYRSEECKSGFCGDGHCAPNGNGKEGEYCYQDKQCESGACDCPSGRMSAGSKCRNYQGVCVAGLPNGRSGCLSDSECASGYCDDNVCAPNGIGQTGDYCHKDEHCANRFCVCPKGFDSDGTCNWYLYLAGQGRCHRWPGSQNGQACSRDDDCTSRYCANGACAPHNDTGREGDYCHHNDHCISGQCDCEHGETNIWGFCPKWENYEPHDRGSCTAP